MVISTVEETRVTSMRGNGGSSEEEEFVLVQQGTGCDHIVDLTPGPSESRFDPIAQIRQLLRQGFCEPANWKPASPEAHRQTQSSYIMGAGNDAGDLSFSSIPSQASYEPIIINLKKALQQHGFCVPTETVGANRVVSPKEGDCANSLMTQSCDWDDENTAKAAPATSMAEGIAKNSKTSKVRNSKTTEKLDCRDEALMEEDDDDVYYLVVTEPGCDRGERITRVLEIFLFAIFFLYATFYALNQYGEDIKFDLRRKS